MATILILEDDVRLARHWQMAFEQHGYGVIHETTADAAIDVLQQTQIDLVVSDVLIRGKENTLSPKGGFTLLSHVRLNMNPTPKVISVTGANPTLNIDRIAKSLNADWVFTKPVNVDELIEKIKELLTSDEDITT